MRTSRSTTIGALALAALLVPNGGYARSDEQQVQGERPSVQHGVEGSHDGGTAKMPTMAPEFVAHAARDGIAEVELGKLASARAASEDVKQFARRMVDDHSKANDELKSLASSKNIPVPTDTDAEHKMLMDKLGKVSGAEFDRAFMDAMVTDHDHAVAKFRAFSERGDDPELKKWAEKTLPTLQAHERMAKETAAKVGASGKVAEQSSRDKAIAY
jgi:putative membrane protein